MPTTKEILTRLRILDTLLSNRTIKYDYDSLLEEVNERLKGLDKHISRRTLLYDLENIELEFGNCVTILRTPETFVSQKTGKTTTKTWVRYEDPHSSIFKKPMTEEETYLLGQTLSLLGNFEGIPSLQQLESLRGSIKKDYQFETAVVMESSCLEQTSCFGELFAAITIHKPVEIHHHRFNSPDCILTHLVYPYQLREYNNRWYLIGCTVIDGAPKDVLWPYRLDSMDKVVIRQDLPYHMPPESIVDHFEDVVGITRTDAPCQEILFWVSDKSCGYVASKPIHASQTQLKESDSSPIRNQYPMFQGGKFFKIECKENYELIRELCSFGGELVVISPDNIQASVVAKSKKLLERYQLITQ